MTRLLKFAGLAGYLGVIAAALAFDVVPRLFWTVLLPLLPLAIVLMGFYRWRVICPLAALGTLGRSFPRKEQRRVPAWLERGFFLVTFGVLLAMLVLRLIATNGDGVWLAGLLIGAALAAVATNAVFTGKSWCNFICPVGLVERIYTEPASLADVQPTSRCVRCTACKRNCPDIDQENGYWKDLSSDTRRVAAYAFPGLVLGFYVYYWLRAGTWAAYFDGGWTTGGATTDLAFGPGFFFAPQVPAVVAATLTLVAFSAASLALFAALEAAIAPLYRGPDAAERRRHHVLALAAFSAFNAFYAFAGAPTLLRIGGGVRVAAFVAPVVATLFLVRRWGRTRVDYLQTRSVRTLLKRWRFEEAPPTTTAGVAAYVRGHENARRDQLEAYRDTIRDVVADGIVSLDERRLLDQLRESLAIDERDHQAIVDALDDEAQHLLTAEPMSVERRLQVDSYQRAFSQAVLDRAPAPVLEALRADWGIDQATHAQVTSSLRAAGGPLQESARRYLAHIGTFRQDLRGLAAMKWVAPFAFLVDALLKRQDRLVDRVVEALALASDAPARVRDVAPDLFAPDKTTRAAALDILVETCDAAQIDTLRPIVMDRMPKKSQTAEPIDVRAVLERLATADSPWLRAGSVMAMGQMRHPDLSAALDRAAADPHPVVREEAEALQQMAAQGTLPTARPVDEAGTGRYVAAVVPDAAFDSLTIIDRMLFLRCVQLFVDLDPEDLHTLAAGALEVRHDAGAALWKADRPVKQLAVIVSGGVTLQVSGSGDQVEAAQLGPGELIGELAVLDGSLRSASVTAGEKGVRLLLLDAAGCRALLLRGDVAPQVTAMLARRLRDTLQRLGRGR